MEKKTPHYKLSVVKKLIADGKYKITRTALVSAFNDFDFKRDEQITGEVVGLEVKNLFKSMTTIGNHKEWQDVYHKRIQDKIAYIKIQIVNTETVIISFKER